MSAVFRMKAAGGSISSLLRGRPLSRFSGGTTAPWTPSTAVRVAPGKRAYLKSPDLPGKSAELDVSPGALSYSSRLVGWYMGLVQSRPILTKSVTCSCIYTASDLSSQAIMGPSLESYDPTRTMRMAGYGMVVLGPTLHFWFSVMSKFFPKRDLASTLKKMALGQVIYGPVMTAVFFSINATLQGEKSSEVVARLKRDLFPTLVNGVMYWPLCDFITFRFIPVHLQPLMSNGFSYVWTIYLSYIASLAKRRPKALLRSGDSAKECHAPVHPQQHDMNPLARPQRDSFHPGDNICLTNRIFSYSGNRNAIVPRVGNCGSIGKFGVVHHASGKYAQENVLP